MGIINGGEEKLPPYNPEAEEALLGSCLIDPDALTRVSAIVKPDDFFREDNARIFAAMLALRERGEPPNDILLLQDALGENGPSLSALVDAVPTSVHAEHYARLIANHSIQRQVIDYAQRVTELAWREGTDANTLVAQVQAEVMKIAVQSDQAVTTQDLCSAHYDRTDAINRTGAKPGLKTGLPDLDKLIRLEGAVYVAGRPSQGKSVLVLGIALDVACNQGGRVLYFSVEDSQEMWTNRALACLSGLNVTDLANGSVTSEWAMPRYLAALSRLSSLSIIVDDGGAPTVAHIAAVARREMAAGGIDLIVVDYLQLCRLGEKAGNRTEEVGKISHALKALGRELGIPILCVSPLSRGVEGRADKRPVLSDMRESGDLESDADTVIFVYREGMYGGADPHVAELIVAKQRNGPTGTVQAWFDGSQAKFRPVEVKTVRLNGEPEEL